MYMFICNHRRPTDRVRRMARRRPKAAHTDIMHVRDAVFHAPMFALNADAPQNACTQNNTQSTPTEVLARIGIYTKYTHTHTHTYMYTYLYIYI